MWSASGSRAPPAITLRRLARPTCNSGGALQTGGSIVAGQRAYVWPRATTNGRQFRVSLATKRTPARIGGATPNEPSAWEACHWCSIITEHVGCIVPLSSRPSARRLARALGPAGRWRRQSDLTQRPERQRPKASGIAGCQASNLSAKWRPSGHSGARDTHTHERMDGDFSRSPARISSDKWR